MEDPEDYYDANEGDEFYYEDKEGEPCVRCNLSPRTGSHLCTPCFREWLNATGDTSWEEFLTGHVAVTYDPTMPDGGF